MKGKLLRDKDSKWVVEYRYKETIANETLEDIKQLPLHPENIVKVEETLGDVFKLHTMGNQEVEFEIVYDTSDNTIGILSPTATEKFAKLLPKQEESTWEDIFSGYYRRNWGFGWERDKSTLEEWLKKYYSPPQKR